MIKALLVIGHGSRESTLADAGLDLQTLQSRIERWWQIQAARLNGTRTAPRMVKL